jgi:uncharacterized membrane protein YphA (DoxX/SURF4 family)
MAIDRQGTGLTILRILIGVFFFFLGIGKIRWFTDPSILARQFDDWTRAAAAGSVSQWYMTRIAMPGVAVFARLVPFGEIAGGLALIAGVWTPLVAFLAFLMVLNIHVASGAIFRYSFLTNGYGLPVLGATLALAIGGVRLKWSLRQ